ncbi:MAG: PIN domain-containing protein [Gemmatimonadota bacterium]|nr:PIN domain-containing protein [Gemmatimonadota bacterium]
MKNNKPAVYIDSCCFIDMVAYDTSNKVLEDRKEHIWYYKRLLSASKNEDITVVTSYLTINECLHVKDDDDKKVLDENVKNLFNSILLSGQQFGGVYSAVPDEFILEHARNLNWEHDIRLDPFDSLHIATALWEQCDEFVTTDKNSIDKQGNIVKLEKMGLRVIEAVETKSLPEEYLQMNTHE